MSDDDQLFAKEMLDVVPIAPTQRVQPKVRKTDEETLANRRAAAVTHGKVDDNYLVAEGIEPLDRYYILDFKRPGIQNGVYRKLKQGKYMAEATLDLHRLTVQQARKEVFEFIHDAEGFGLRTVLVIHGKGGAKSGVEGGVLKAYVNRWLQDIPQVQAFHSATKRHGSTGSVYVLLRKSESKKQENRLRINKGRE